MINAVKDIEVPVDNDDQGVGVSIVIKAIEEPLRQMAVNCGMSPDIVVKQVRSLEDNHGINFMTGDVQNLVDIGVIDPAKVTRCALQNAVSVASTIITTSHAIVSS